MTKNKRLIVYPHNFFKPQMGIDSRFLELVKYYKKRNFIIDVFALKNFVSKWEKETYKDQELVDNIYFFDFSEGYNNSIKTNKTIVDKNIKFPELLDYAYKEMQEDFNVLLEKTAYDYVLISYVYWAKLIENNKLIKGKTILDLSDFTTLILNDMSSGSLNVGKIFEEEVRRINLFDEVMCISYDEMWLFSQFAKNPKYHYIPHFIENKSTESKKIYDILLLGSDNSFNVEGIKWFLENIYPKLNKNLKILAVGKITKYIDIESNIEKKGYVENLDEVYKSSKILVAPLFGGTGIKIKVIEALSYGVPVVTTSKGVIGFKDKNNNGCLITDDLNEFIININKLLEDNDFAVSQRNKAVKYFLENFCLKKII